MKTWKKFAIGGAAVAVVGTGVGLLMISHGEKEEAPASEAPPVKEEPPFKPYIEGNNTYTVLEDAWLRAGRYSGSPPVATIKKGSCVTIGESAGGVLTEVTRAAQGADPEVKGWIGWQKIEPAPRCTDTGGVELKAPELAKQPDYAPAEGLKPETRFYATTAPATFLYANPEPTQNAVARLSPGHCVEVLESRPHEEWTKVATRNPANSEKIEGWAWDIRMESAPRCEPK